MKADIFLRRTWHYFTNSGWKTLAYINHTCRRNSLCPPWPPFPPPPRCLLERILERILPQSSAEFCVFRGKWSRSASVPLFTDPEARSDDKGSDLQTAKHRGGTHSHSVFSAASTSISSGGMSLCPQSPDAKVNDRLKARASLPGGQPVATQEKCRQRSQCFPCVHVSLCVCRRDGGALRVTQLS